MAKKVFPKKKPLKRVTVTKDSGPEEMPEDTEIAKYIKALSFRQKIWADAFIKCLNKKKASLVAGCTEENANSYAAYMYGLQVVRDYIEYVVSLAIGTVDDNIKLVQTIRDARLNDYMVKVKVIKSDLVKTPLAKVIERTRVELLKEEEYFMLAEEPKEITAGMQRIKTLRKSIKKYEIDLRHDPKAHVLEYGPSYLADNVELDLVKLAADKENGIIKSFKHTKDGIHVEFHSQLDAANTLARIQGADKGTTNTTNVYTGPTAEQLSKLTDQQLKAMAEIEKIMKS